MNSGEDSIPVEITVEKAHDDSNGIIIDLESQGEEPPMYKKVKLSEMESRKNMAKNQNSENGQNSSASNNKSKKDTGKKAKEANDTKTDDKEESKESKDTKRNKDGSATKKKKKDKSENNQRCTVCKKIRGNMIFCDHCPRSYHLECINLKSEDVPKGAWYCEKCRDKRKVEKKKKKSKDKGKDDKKPSKDDKTQTKIDTMGSGTKKAAKPARKQKDDLEKKFQEFAKKYPQYVQKGKVKFPIEDRLLTVYSQIFDSGTKVMKPQAKKSVIPPNLFSDIMQIWNFFYNYSDLFKFEDIAKEEIYAALNYQGPQYLLLVNDMHQGLLSLFLQEFKNKNRFDTQKDEAEFPFFVLAKNYINDELNGDEMTGIWTEFLRNLSRTPNALNALSATSQKNIETLALHTPLQYNSLEYKAKIRVLVDLIELIYDTELFRDFMHQRMEEVNHLVREKNELMTEIKQDEAEIRDLKARNKELEASIAKEEAKKLLVSRNEFARNVKNIEADKREHLKSQSTIAKLDNSVQKKKSRLHKITSDLVNPVQTAYLIGQDCDKNEYWLFFCEPNRIYVRNPAGSNLNGEENWHFYDKEEELEQLQKSLNPKGIREKNLSDNLQNLIKNKLIELEDEVTEITNDDIANDPPIKFKDENKDKDMLIEQNGDHTKPEIAKDDEHIEEKTTTSTFSAATKANKESMDFWFGKVLEYEASMMDESTAFRTTRWRKKQSYKKDDDELSHKNYKNFSLEGIKGMIRKSESVLTDYLAKWGSRWAKPSIKEEILAQLEKADKAQDIALVLLRLNEEWQKCESLKKKKNYEIEVEEEEEPAENEAQSQASQKSQKNSVTKENNEKSANPEEGNEEDEFYFGANPDENKDSANGNGKKEEEEETKKLSPKREELRRIDAKFEGYDESLYKIRKIPLRLWGLINEKFKRCWVSLTSNADNLSAAYFSTFIFCDNVQRYASKKSKQYFAANKQHKENQHKAQAAAASTKNEPKDDQLNLDDIDQFRFTRSQARELREGDRRPNEPVASKYLAPTRRKEEKDDRPEYKYISQNERTRSKQDKLNELLGAMQDDGVRRSERNLNKRKKNLDEDFEDEEEEEPVVENPNMVKCQMCQSKYFLDDIGLKAQPEGIWQCFECLEKLAGQRHTRSTTRRLGN